VRPARLVAAAQALAVDGDDPVRRLDPRRLAEGGREAGEGGRESLRIEQAKDPAEGAVARDAVLQHQELAQQSLLGPPELGHLGAGLRPAQARRERDEQQLGQVVVRVDVARIGQSREHRLEHLHRDLP